MLLLLGCIALMLCVQLDWLTGGKLQALIAIGNASTKFSTATMLEFAAIGLLLSQPGSRHAHLARMVGAVVSAIAITYLVRIAPPASTLLQAPSPATSAMCLLLGINLVLRDEADRVWTGAALTAGLAALIAISGMFAWLTDPRMIPQLGPFASMGIVTVVIGLLLGTIALVSDPRIPLGLLLRDTGKAGKLFRRALVILLLLIAVLATLTRARPTADTSTLLTYVFVDFALVVGAGIAGLALLVQHLSRAEHATTIARNAREASEAFADRVLSAVPNAILVVSLDGVIVRANSHAGKLFNYSPAEMVGLSVDTLLPVEVRDRHRQYRAEYSLQPTAREMGKGRLLRALRADGTTFPVEVGLNPLSAADIDYIVVSIIDLTERMTYETQLKEHAEALERSNTELERFAFVASHDLKEPLRAVEGFSILLRDEYARTLDAKGGQWLNQVVTGAQRMRSLIDDLLLLSRVRTQEVRMEQVDLEKLLEEVIADCSASLQETGATVSCLALPEVYGDPGLLQRLFGNLLSNAIKYRSERPPHIEISAKRVDGFCHIDVADNGIGIDEKYYETIFEVFKRLHGRGKIEGTGMGLAICRSIVKRHGGHIRVSSVSGEGSTFQLTLPADAAAFTNYKIAQEPL